MVVTVAWLGCKRGEASPDLAQSGRAIFASTCARCHGAHGGGGVAPAPGQPAPRDLRDPTFQASRTDEPLRAVVSGGKGAAMPSFAAVLGDKELRALVAFLRTLDPKRPL